MRTAATVVGISWMDAVLHTTSMHKLSLATPGVRRLIRRAASSPRGVAALPSPSRLAETLAAMVSMVPRSPAKSGNSRRRMGRSRRASFSASPARCMTSITPIHRQRTPAMEIPSSMAEGAKQGKRRHSCPDHRHCHGVSSSLPAVCPGLFSFHPMCFSEKSFLSLFSSFFLETTSFD